MKVPQDFPELRDAKAHAILRISARVEEPANELGVCISHRDVW